MALPNPQAQQLDRLGRELKCPICLSLFKQAASLSCNHTFCTSCITQSMKQNPACPICKVHTTRREVRAAPQMDTMVSIYVSMGNAAGMDPMASQFTSNNETVHDTSKIQDKKQRHALADISNGERQPQTKPRNSRISSKKCEQIFQGPVRTKKRVQVPHFTSLSGELGLQQYDLVPAEKSGRLHRPSELKHLNDDVATREKGRQSEEHVLSQKSPPVSNCKPSTSRKKARGRQKKNATLTIKHVEPSLEETRATCLAEAENCPNAEVHDGNSIGKRTLDPFFWLGNVNSQETEALQTTQTTAELPHITPNEPLSFSDLKESDDVWVQDNNDEEVTKVDATADSYDSDYFEWTQQPCSPELKCTPVKEVPKKGFFIDLPVDQTQPSSDECMTLENEVQIENISGSYPLTLSPQNAQAPVCTADKSTPKAKASTQTEGVEGKPYRKKGKADDRQSSGKKVSGLKRKISQLDKSPRKQSSISCTNADDGTKGKEELGCLMRNLLQPNKPFVKKKQLSNDCNDVPDEPRSGFKRKLSRLDKPLRKKKQSSNACTNASENVEKLSPVATRDVARPPKKKKPISNKSTFEDLGQMHVLEGTRDLARTNNYQCAFCRACGDSKVAGPMIHYNRGGISLKEWEADARVFHVHKNCAEWAPDVYFVDDVAMNLPGEVARGQKIKCSNCGKRGAALGCCLKRCRKSYHYPCAHGLSCKWDEDRFIMFCPDHVAKKFPTNKLRAPRLTQSSSTLRNQAHELSNFDAAKVTPSEWSYSASSKWIMTGSALDSNGKEQLADFARRVGASVTKTWSSSVTHVVAGTDKGGAPRTLKYLMAILEGKWIVQSEWIAACISAGKPVSEEQFEVRMDIHGVADGPKRGRLLAAAKAPKLFEGLQFYFMPTFPTSYKPTVQSLVVAGGGIALNRKPIALDSGAKALRERTIVVYKYDDEGKNDQAKVNNSRRQAEAITMSALVGAQAVPHCWILDSIASCQVQPLA